MELAFLFGHRLFEQSKHIPLVDVALEAELVAEGARQLRERQGRPAEQRQVVQAMDEAFGVDQRRARVKNAAQNFAILRRIVINLLRPDSTTKVGAKTKRQSLRRRSLPCSHPRISGSAMMFLHAIAL